MNKIRLIALLFLTSASIASAEETCGDVPYRNQDGEVVTLHVCGTRVSLPNGNVRIENLHGMSECTSVIRANGSLVGIRRKVARRMCRAFGFKRATGLQVIREYYGGFRLAGSFHGLVGDDGGIRATYWSVTCKPKGETDDEVEL